MRAAGETVTFRLAPRDRTGIILGLGGAQCAAGAAGLGLAVVSFFAGHPLVGIGCLALGGIGATARRRGTPVVAMAPEAARAVQHAAAPGRRRWVSDLRNPGLPQPLASQRILEVPARRFGHLGAAADVAVVHDEHTGVWAATLRVTGPAFTLAAPADQVQHVRAWSAALAPLSREASPVRWVRWSEWAGPATMEEHRAWFAEQVVAERGDPARESYEAMLDGVAPASTNHDVLITLAVDEAACTARRDQRHRRRGREQRRELALEVLGRETRLLAGRLEQASLTVRGPLTAAQLARAVAERLAPPRARVIDTRTRSLGAEMGLVSPETMGPHHSEMSAGSWCCDGTWHRGFYIEDWPRSEIAADWLAPLLLVAGPVRSVSMFYEPVAPSRSRRGISSQAAKLESDADQRSRQGFRVTADLSRQRQAVDEREWEIVAGFREQDYAGLVAVSAASSPELDDMCADLIQVAAAVGIELRELWWRHDQVTAATLPLAFGLAPTPFKGMR